MRKRTMFFIVTILFLETLSVNLNVRNGFRDNIILILMYIGFILVSLYELGKDDTQIK